MANERALEPVSTVLTIGAMSLCLKSLGAVGATGGDPIDATCLSNVEFITKQPQTLKEIPDIAFTSMYTPSDLADILTEINSNQVISIAFAAGEGTLTFWGYLKSYEPKEAGKGEGWEATGSVVVTNLDGTGVEVGPIFAP